MHQPRQRDAPISIFVSSATLSFVGLIGFRDFHQVLPSCMSVCARARARVSVYEDFVRQKFFIIINNRFVRAREPSGYN